MGLVSANRRGRPIFVGFNSNNGANPALPAHIPGDTIVAHGMHNTSTTLPTATNYNLWGDGSSGNSCALAILTRTATLATHTISFTGVSNTRAVWVFRNAKLGKIAYFNAATGTDLDWPALADMKPGSIICASLISRAAQADLASLAPVSGMTERAATLNAAASRWLADTNTDLHSSFAGLNDLVFGASTSGSCGAVFSIEPLD